MCLGLVGRIVELVDGRTDLAMVDIAGVRRPINLGLLEDDERPAPGGWILVHMGFALQTMTEDEAAEALASLDSYSAERLADGGEAEGEPRAAVAMEAPWSR